VLASDGSVYVLTDYGRDFIGLAHINVPGSLEFLVAEAADLDLLTLDDSGHMLAYTVNREGFSELHLRDLVAGQDRHIPAFDQAVVFDLVFDADSKCLAVTHSGPDHNMNISLVTVASGKVERLTYAPMTGLNPKSLVIPTVMRYPSFDSREIPAYLYRPPLSGNLPVVISVHGGPEAQERPYFSGWYQYLLAHGYALVTPNVRGSTGYGKAYSHLDDREQRMDSVRDIASLVEWIRVQPGLDGRRIAIYGGSYGGFMVLSAITQYPDLFQAAIDIVGRANLESFLENTSEWRRALREVEYGYLATDREFLRRFSPVHYVDRIRTPLFVVHGANDPRVPLNEAEQIVGALQERLRPVEFRVFPDEGHGIAKLKNRIALYPEMVDFLDRHLKGQ
jgi:dipeptidyl aminopeptidase/acylaminoacyl peptidase